ncbi:MAG: hypothetical protein PHS82_11815 [Lachnospiraceae bacterium]|nr:hypothetical protein [Lachnospiraceae bacterium]
MQENNNASLEQTGLKRRTREQILALIKADENMYAQFLNLSKSMQEQMLEFCMGKRGLLITYDPFFKMIFNPEDYYHYGKQEFDTGIDINMLQEYIYIPLDIFLDNFHKNTHNEIKELDAWLCFLSSDNLEDMLRILEAYPDFIALYREIMEFQAKPEELIGMFSEALEIMDRNTTRYMIEEQAKEIEEQKKTLTEKDKTLEKQMKEIEELKAELERLKK